MKTNSYTIGLILGLALAPLALAAPAQRGPAAGGPNYNNANGPGAMTRMGECDGSGPGVCLGIPVDTSPLVLDANAHAALLFQIDEERMARELYLAFAEKWGLQPFRNIPQAETRHEQIMRELAVRAGIAAPTSVAGRFDSAEVQQRYDALLALGLESADSALRVGAFVEEQDISDLKALIATTDNEALKNAAMALKTGSGQHLRAFVGVLAARGVTYIPQVLEPDEVQEIIGGGNQGMRRGRGPGRA